MEDEELAGQTTSGGAAVDDGAAELFAGAGPVGGCGQVGAEAGLFPHACPGGGSRRPPRSKTPLRWLYCPVRMQARDGVQIELVQNAFSKVMPSLASVSIVGVGSRSFSSVA